MKGAVGSHLAIGKDGKNQDLSFLFSNRMHVHFQPWFVSCVPLEDMLKPLIEMKASDHSGLTMVR